MNTCTIAGQLVTEPRLATLKDGTKVCTVQIQVNKFNLPVAAYGDMAELLARVKVGKAVTVCGPLSYSEWTTNGQKKFTIQIVARAIGFKSETSEVPA